MKEKKKKITVKNSKVDKVIEEQSNFLWALYDRKEKGSKKTTLYFKRGEVELIDHKGKKQVTKYEKAYKQLCKKRVPVAVIILGLITAAAFLVPTFIKDLEDLFKIILYTVGSIFGVSCFFALIIYVITICKKRSLKEKCVEKAQQVNSVLPGEKDPGQHINEVSDLEE